MTRLVVLIAVTCLPMGGIARALDVGTVASARGDAEVGHDGSRSAATVGMAVQLGDELRTGKGQLRVVFRDDSVIDLSEYSSMIVDQQEFDPEESSFSSLMRLVNGRARALVGKYYRTAGASYEIETPTAVAGVRGTSFIVSYNSDTDSTEVMGIFGQVAVRSLDERIGDTVFITAQEATTVFRGDAPTRPERIDDRYFDYEVEGLELLSLGSVASQTASRAVGGSDSVPATDRAPSSGSLAGQPGRDGLRNSADVAGQPLSVVGTGRGSLGVPF